MKTYGKWRYSSTIVDFCTRWKWMVSFTTQPLNSLGKVPWYALERRLGRPQSLSGRSEVVENLCHLLGIKPRSSIRYSLIISSELSWIVKVFRIFALDGGGCSDVRMAFFPKGKVPSVMLRRGQAQHSKWVAVTTQGRVCTWHRCYVVRHSSYALFAIDDI
jgi:hypothetical protein